MKKSRIPSPARSQGVVTPRRFKPRRSRSVTSPARSNSSARLTSVIDQFKEDNKDSFVLSPFSKTVLTDNTDIEQPRRSSWWKKVENSRDMLEIMKDQNVEEANNVIEEFDVELLSQEKKNYTMDLPESSGSESISSIVVPQRKLFTQKDNPPQNKFGEVIGTRESLAEYNKTNLDKTAKMGPKNLFNHGPKRSKPIFPAALLHVSPNRTVTNKTKEMATETKGQARNLFGNRGGTKRKNMFADFVVSESEDEISEIQPKLFAFQRNTAPVRHSSKGLRNPSPASSLTTDIEMDDWKFLPSSTMVDHQIEAIVMDTPGKKARFSKLSEEKESETETNNTVTVKADKSQQKISKETEQHKVDKEIEQTLVPGCVSKEEVNVINEKLDDETSEQGFEDFHEELKLVYDDKSEEETSDNDAQFKKRQVDEENAYDNKDIQNASQKIVVNPKESHNQNTNHRDIQDEDQNASQAKEEQIVLSKSHEIQDSEEVHNDSEIQKQDDDVREDGDHNASHRKEEEYVESKSGEIQDSEEEGDNEQNETLVENEGIMEDPQETNQNESHIEEQNDDQNISHEEVEKDAQCKNQEEILDSDEYAAIQEQDDDVMESENPNANHAEEENDKSKRHDIQDSDEDENLFKNESVMEEPQETNQIESHEEDQEQDEDPNMSHVEAEEELENKSRDVIQDSEEVDNNEEIQARDDNPKEDDQHASNADEEDEILRNDTDEIQDSEDEDEQDEDIIEHEVVVEEAQETNEDYNEEQDEEQDEDQNEEQDEDLNDEQEEDQNESDAATEDEEESLNQVQDTEEIDENEAIDEQEEDVLEDEDVAEEAQESSETESETRNVTHDTTGRNRKKGTKSPEAILHDMTNQAKDSFIGEGRSTSIKKNKSIVRNFSIRPSLAPPRDSTGFSDGTRNSSAEGSGWDSHRTTRKTLRQTFGKDFTPRKSLRTLVMEKAVKRQTAINEANAAKLHQANSTELPDDGHNDEMEFEENVEIVEQSDHELSKRTRQTTLEMYLQKVKKENIERKLKIEAQVRDSLKSNPFRADFLRLPYKPAIRRPVKSLNTAPKTKRLKPSVIPLEDLPAELIDDMKYKPPKRFRPSNAPWITKRLYKFLECRLESKYDYKARVRAEQLVETIYDFARDTRRIRVATPRAIAELKREMARLNVVKTHFDFYNFFHEYMPVEVKVKVVPDIVNNLPLPRNGIFSDIISENMVEH